LEIVPEMIVEFFGHAASGKSTFCHALAQELAARGIAASVLDARGSLADAVIWRRMLQIYGLFRYPQILIGGLGLLTTCHVRNWRAIGTLGGIAFRWMQISRRAEARRILLVDEGVLHGTWSLLFFANRIEPTSVTKFLARFAVVDVGVSLRPPRAVVLKRLSLRKTPLLLLHGMNDIEKQARLDKLECLLNLSEECVANRGFLMTVQDTSTASVRRVADRLQNIWQLVSIPGSASGVSGYT
jgi:RecA/RadA recombinase